MKFGVILDPHTEKWDLIRYTEELGYTRVGVGDSQMLWSDCYSMLTLAAANTKRISLGTDVAIPGTRIAPDLGEHNETVLTQYLGYDAARVAQLTTAGVLVVRRSGE